MGNVNNMQFQQSKLIRTPVVLKVPIKHKFLSFRRSLQLLWRAGSELSSSLSPLFHSFQTGHCSEMWHENKNTFADVFGYMGT